MFPIPGWAIYSTIGSTAVGDFGLNADKLTGSNLPSNLISAYTVTGWFYRTASTAAGSPFAMAANADNAFNKLIINTSNEVRVGSNLSTSSLITTISLNKWYFAAITQTGATRQLTGWIGEELGSTLTSITVTSINEASACSNLWIGGGNYFGESVLGAMANVRVWTRTLSEAELISEMTSKNPVSSTNLVGHYMLASAATKLTASVGTNLAQPGSGAWTDVTGPNFSS
jgi:hypothetical protein